MAKCGDCLYFGFCKKYVEPEETFPEIEGGCSAFKSKGDFVEVVRCEYCKHYRTSGCAMDTYAFDVVEEGFCSYGERREGE